MAIASVQTVHSQGFTQGGAGPFTTTTFTTTNAVASGGYITMAFAAGTGGSTGITVTSVTDSVGLTWTVDLNQTQGTGSTAILCLASAYAPAGLAAGTTITVTYSASMTGSARMVYMHEWSGLAASSTFDISKGGEGGTSSTSFTTGTSGATTQADELIFAAAVLFTDNTPNTPDWTVGTNYTALTANAITAGTTVRNLVAEYRIVSSTGTYSATGTYVTASAYAAGLATYKASIVTPQIVRPDGQVAAGSWTRGGTDSGTLQGQLDETVLDDTDYIQSSLSPASADLVELSLGDATDPSSSSGHIVRYRYKKSSSGGDRIDLTVRLMQGATEIVEWTHTDISATAATATQTLSGAEADAITDYANLRLQFEAIKP